MLPTKTSRKPQVKRRILLIHQNFPGQFRYLAQHLAALATVELVTVGHESAAGLPGIETLRYRLHRAVNKQQTHPYVQQMESAVLYGQAVVRVLHRLREQGFVPDTILAHPGWGETLYVKEIFPQARLVHFCEWFYSAYGADVSFDAEFPSSADTRLRVTTWNALHLMNLQNCDVAITPTAWQKAQHPANWHDKIRLLHEGVDTQNLGPDPQAVVEIQGQRFAAGEPLITYVSRNLEPYRGFHTLMRALPQVLAANPKVRVLVVGGDEASYGSLPKDAAHWREKMCRDLGGQLDLTRVHFVGKVPYAVYKKVLQVSTVHVYLSYPFVLSWSMLEAMASGCLILGSDTPPVREVLRHGENGLLTDFFDAPQLAKNLLTILANSAENPAFYAKLREQALQDAQQKYALEQGLNGYLELLDLPR